MQASKVLPCSISHTTPSFIRRRILNIYHSTPIFVKYNRRPLPKRRTTHLSHPNHIPSRTLVLRADTPLRLVVYAVAANLQRSHCDHSPFAWAITSNLHLMTWLTGLSKLGVLLEINDLAS